MLASAESINQRNPTPNTRKRAPGTGYYLALTFGTLLSSQGADAQQLHPLGLHRQRLVHLTPCGATVGPGGLTGWASRPRAAHRRPYTNPAAPCHRLSEAEEGLDPHGEPRVLRDLPDGQQHSRHE